MLNKINLYYKKRGFSIPKEELEIISTLITCKTLKKKDFFYKIGDTNTSAGYILQGGVRVFIKDKNKNEYNRFFAFEDSWIGEYHQIINDLPSKTSVQALEKTDILEITKESFDIIFDSCPVFTKATFNLYLKNYADLLEKEEIKKTLTIEELYQDLLDNVPQIIKRVPLYHIASYLGVKPESLSRVKKKFQEYTTSYC